MATQGFVQLPLDTSNTGKKEDHVVTTPSGQYREVVTIGGPSADDAYAPVDSTSGLKVNLGADNDVTVADGSDVNAGTTTDAAVTGDNSGTLSAKLRGLNKILANVWDSINSRLNVYIQNATLAVTQSGTWNVTNVSGTVSLPTGASTAANQATEVASLASIDGKVPALGQALAAASVPVILPSATITTLTPPAAITGFATEATLSTLNGKVTAVNTGAVVVSSSALPTGAATETTLGTRLTESDFDTKIGSLTETAPGTDTASSGLNGRLQRIAQRLTSLITAVGSPFQAGGSIGNTTFASTQSGTWTVQPGNTANTTAWKVDGSAVTQPVSAASLPLPTGAATSALQTQPGVDIGDVTVNNAAGASAVNVQDGGNSLTVDGAVTVTNATAANLKAEVVGTGTFAVQAAAAGDVAHDAVDSGNPLKVGGKATNAEPAAVASGDRANFITDLVGKLITLPYSNPENFVSGAITSAMTSTTSTSLVAAPAAGLRNYITTIIVTNSHATVGTDVIIQDGSGGTTLLTIPAAAVYGGAVITLPTPLRQPTTATALYCANVTSGANTKVSAVGYKGA